MLKKHIRGGGESIADARQPTYDPNVFLRRVPNLKNLLKDEKAQGKEIFDPPKLDGQGIGEKRQSTIPKNGPIVSGPSPSLRFDSASPVGTILSPSTRISYTAAIVKGKGNPPAQKRKIADGLGDLERYSERKKKQTITNKKRAVSSYVARA